MKINGNAQLDSIITGGQRRECEVSYPKVSKKFRKYQSKMLVPCSFKYTRNSEFSRFFQLCETDGQKLVPCAQDPRQIEFAITFLVTEKILVSDVNECDRPDICENGVCINEDGAFKCKCNQGYQLVTSNDRCAGMTQSLETRVRRRWLIRQIFPTH